MMCRPTLTLRGPQCDTLAFASFVGNNIIGVRKIKKGCHAEALEACALGFANYALTIMHSVKAFAHMLPFDKLRTGFASA